MSNPWYFKTLCLDCDLTCYTDGLCESCGSTNTEKIPVRWVNTTAKIRWYDFLTLFLFWSIRDLQSGYEERNFKGTNK